MRKIKFRVWNRLTLEMSNAEDREMVIDSDGVIMEHYHDISSDNPNDLGVEFLDQDQLIVMEWIGHNDRNGKLIFEGDIIIEYGYQATQIESKTQGVDIIVYNPKVQVEKNRGVVAYMSEHNMAEFTILKADESNLQDLLQQDTSYGYQIISDFTYWDQLEVIGNIYENPEMIQKKEEL